MEAYYDFQGYARSDQRTNKQGTILVVSISIHVSILRNKNLPGFAKWLHLQADEERGHGMKLYEHLVDRGGRVVLKAIAAPPTEWKSNLETFKEVQAHEAAVTASINSPV